MKYSVVSVDDEMVARAYIGRMQLWQEGEFDLAYQANSAQDVLDYLSRKHADILLMDVSMPDMNGVELSAILHERYPAMLVIAVSNYDNYDYVRQIMRNGAYDYVLKGRLTEEGLRELLRSCVQKSRERNSEDSRNLLRRRMREWLKGQCKGPSPLPNDGSRLVVSFGQILWPDSYSEAQSKAAAAGIEELLESISTPEMDILCVYWQKGLFILFFRLYQTISAQKIQVYLYLAHRQQESCIQEMYHMQLVIRPGPQMNNPQSAFRYVLHYLENVPQEPVAVPVPSGLTLVEQKNLLQAMEDGSVEQTQQILAGLQQKVSGNEAYLMYKELMELAENAAREWKADIVFPFTGNKWFDYLRTVEMEQAWTQLRQRYAELGEQMKRKRMPLSSEPVKKALQYLYTHYAEPVSFQEMARELNLSAPYLSRLFRRETGTTLIDTLNTIRIEKAKELLIRGVSLKEIALSCGFSQYSYFLRVFKAQTSLSPKQYIEKEKNEQ